MSRKQLAADPLIRLQIEDHDKFHHIIFKQKTCLIVSIATSERLIL